MKKLYDYGFYRTAEFYKKTEGGDFCFRGLVLLYVGIIANYLFCQNLIVYLLGLQWKDWMIPIPVTVAVIVILLRCRYFDNESKYKQLEKKYQNDPKRGRRGIAVFAYIIVSFVLFMLSISCFRLPN